MAWYSVTSLCLTWCVSAAPTRLSSPYRLAASAGSACWAADLRRPSIESLLEQRDLTGVIQVVLRHATEQRVRSV